MSAFGEIRTWTVKLFDFLRKMDGPSRNLDKANFSPKNKGKQCAALVVQIHFMAPMVCLRAFASSSLCTEACIFAEYLSLYNNNNNNNNNLFL